jgi:hypothetical protein
MGSDHVTVNAKAVNIQQHSSCHQTRSDSVNHQVVCSVMNCQVRGLGQFVGGYHSSFDSSDSISKFTV